MFYFIIFFSTVWFLSLGFLEHNGLDLGFQHYFSRFLKIYLYRCFAWVCVCAACIPASRGHKIPWTWSDSRLGITVLVLGTGCNLELSVVVHDCNPSPDEADMEESQVQAPPVHYFKRVGDPRLTWARAW